MKSKDSQPPRPLTAKEKSVLEFIESFTLDQGIAPSFQEIKDHFGFASFNSVQRYIKQLQAKEYIHVPGGNQKRAITLLKSSDAIQSSITQLSAAHRQNPFTNAHQKETPPALLPAAESLSLPLLGRVAAGQPIEALDHDEFVEVPASWIKHPKQTFALRVEGQSMIEDGIFDGDIVFVQEQRHANNGEIIVAVVEDEATVKRFYVRHKHKKEINRNPQSHTHLSFSHQVELRPSNSEMQSMWFRPDQVDIRGIVVGLMRKY